MKISGFTIARNCIKFNYPLIASIQSILPLCDEFIINVGDSEDETLSLIHSIKSDKIRIIQNIWDFSKGPSVLSEQTNLALKECKGDWAFYLQSDEIVHECDLPRLKKLMTSALKEDNIDALRFQWFHFYASYFRYRIDKGWYQKQDRIIRNNGSIQSIGDAWGFGRIDGKDLRRKNTGSYIYHYGWVQPKKVMQTRRLNADNIGFIKMNKSEKEKDFNFQDVNQFPVYFGSQPKVMKELIENHTFSQDDKKFIAKKYWWYPPHLFNVRYKTGRRIKESIV